MGRFGIIILLCLSHRTVILRYGDALIIIHYFQHFFYLDEYLEVNFA